MSIVRENLMNEPGYSPYCGAENCNLRWPRTRFNGQQFACRCGFETTFEPEFIAAYKAKWARADVAIVGAGHAGIAGAVGLASALSVLGAETVAPRIPRLPNARRILAPNPEREAAAQAKRARKAAKRLRDEQQRLLRNPRELAITTGGSFFLKRNTKVKA